jgi:hypothetical protein
MSATRQDWGRWAERVVAASLRHDGWHIVRTADIMTRSGGPRAEGDDTNIVLMDIMRLSDGQARWGEIKWKDSPFYWRATGQWLHGIDRPLWRQYLELQHRSGVPGDLFLLEGSRVPGGAITPSLLMQSLDILRGCIAHESNPGDDPQFPQGATNWTREMFVDLGQLSEPPPPELGDTVKAMLRGWHRTHLPQAQWWRKKCIIRGCDRLVPPDRTDANLCDEHYAPVSDEAIARHLARLERLRNQNE